MKITNFSVSPILPRNTELIEKIKKLGKKFDHITPFYDIVNKTFAKDLTDDWKKYDETVELDGFKYRVVFTAKK